jgi:hypothetical protein
MEDNSALSTLPAGHSAAKLALSGAALDIVLAATLGVFLASATSGPGDAVPRPLVIAILFSVPGVIAALGAVGHRRGLLIASAAILIPGSVLSFALVTLIFIFPAAMFVAAAARMPHAHQTLVSRLAGFGLALGVLALVLAAAWALLLGLTDEACFSVPGGSGCGSGLISFRGAVIAAVLAALAIVLAAAPAVMLQRNRRGRST